MKLYSPGARLAYLKRKSRKEIKRFLWGLTLKPGDLISCCSSTNETIIEIDPEYYEFSRSKKGWYLSDFQIWSTGGGHSFNSCGVGLPETREVIEANILSWYKSEDCLRWNEGELSDKAKAQVDILESGGHICDEQGVIFPYWK